jgi:protein farnesyltransferase subunit beta
MAASLAGLARSPLSGGVAAPAALLDVERGVVDDGYKTETSLDQQHLEFGVRKLLREWVAKGRTETTALQRDTHTRYLLSALEGLPEGYSMLDASQPWLLYWIVHSLNVLDVPLPQTVPEQVIGYLRLCQHPSGGFGGGPGQEPHLAPTYAATNALASLGLPHALDAVDRAGLVAFLKRVKDPSGGFRVSATGELDSRGTYMAVSAASLCGVLVPELVRGTAEFLASCQTYEGGFGGEPGNEAHGGYTFASVAALLLLQRSSLIDVRMLRHWAASRQMPLEGGFQGRTNKLVDGCYSFWVGAIFSLLDLVAAEKGDAPARAPVLDALQLHKYVLVCCQQPSGGLKDKPEKRPDLFHTCYCLSGLAVAQQRPGGPHLLGDARNLVQPVNPVYNVSARQLAAALRAPLQ